MSIVAGDIKTGAVTSAEILELSIVAGDIKTGAVTTNEILALTIAAADITTGAITSAEILDLSIAAADITTGAITTNEILELTIAAGDITTGAVTGAKILDLTIAAGDITTGAVTTAKLLDNTITSADLKGGEDTADAAVPFIIAESTTLSVGSGSAVTLAETSTAFIFAHATLDELNGDATTVYLTVARADGDCTLGLNTQDITHAFDTANSAAGDGLSLSVQTICTTATSGTNHVFTATIGPAANDDTRNVTIFAFFLPE